MQKLSEPLRLSTRKPHLRGLYAITDSKLLNFSQLLEAVSQLLCAGVVLIQYRDKDTDAPRRKREAIALVALCRNHGVPLIINDDVALALASGADGVHLGSDDATLIEAREVLGAQAIIGVSCYNSLQGAIQAQEGGADYVAFGRFFASATKPEALPAAMDLLVRARAHLHIPIAAIGGITPDNGGQMIKAGADLLAVVQGVFGQTDFEHAARNYQQLFI